MGQVSTSRSTSALPDERIPGSLPPTSSGLNVDAQAAVRDLARTHYENFSVLSVLVPRPLRPAFAAVYAFCRVSDDLADEGGPGPQARAAALASLADWRRQLHVCFDADQPAVVEHPVFQALRPVIAQHKLPRKPFDDLLDAFEQDQRTETYETWAELLAYCDKSASPVGRIVLMLAGYRPPEECPANAARYELSGAVCVALQLTNFWQDVRRDLIERDRVYLPREICGLDRVKLRAWLGEGEGSLHRAEFAGAVAPCIARTWALFQRGRELRALLDRSIGPVVGLFQDGGEHVLRAIERHEVSTLWHRPRLSRPRKAWLVGRAWLTTLFPTGGRT